jgi:hypothetical protein
MARGVKGTAVHGTDSMYQRGCRQDCCRTAHRRATAIYQGRDPDTTRARLRRATGLDLVRERVAERAARGPREPVDRQALEELLGLLDRRAS